MASVALNSTEQKPTMPKVLYTMGAGCQAQWYVQHCVQWCVYNSVQWCVQGCV